ncbi:hypothetical protein B0T10DRAFT_285231 [Thelonectria olida]|uniref:Rhomboid-type serine protease n=1 Tax=Thelonectria olida TaxID=1576542 RepID=A0A9P8W7J3_9HYPO|nr:hypothetical protein B0T10DRAFT_285231 [Thelonectria olida]
MASHDYYNGHQQAPYTSTVSPSPYHHQNDTPSPSSTPAPPYQAAYTAPTFPPQGTNSHDNSYHNSPVNQHPGTTQSPFDSVFDDNAYPMHQDQRPAHGTSSGDISQQGYYYQDTSYNGGAAGGVASASPHRQPSYPQEDIPLQDRNKDAEMNDHIYDAPGGHGSRNRDKRGKVRLGELGMFGSDKKRIPWVVYIFTLAQVGVFIGEIARNAILTGSPIMIKPSFNPMIGPSTQVLINMGARYVPCMHNVDGIQSNGTFPVLCPNATKTTQVCTLSELCGFGGVPNPNATHPDKYQSPEPNQWFRFILPIFMHAGLIHIGFNMLLQMTMGKEMEMAIGSIRFFLVYVSSGIFGFVMGGNYAAPGITSTGASGCLFGVIALTLLDLLYSWKERKSPVKDLAFIGVDVIISFVLGLLPGLDNFSHIGGFLMGLALGICVLHSPNSLRRRMGQDLSYAAVSPATGETPPPFFKNPVGFFKGRKPLWWVWWLIRAGFLVLVIVVFILLVNNFYAKDPQTCSWCKYLSCLPVKDWCELGTY